MNIIMDGVINVNKPSGMTSHDVVSRIRREFGIKRVGHTGTLDPDAVGVLPVCIGKATKIAELLTAEEKQYIAEVKLGEVTDTQDSSGVVIEEYAVNVSETEIREAVNSFIGESEQIPPMYSAIKIDGVKLYELARKGVEVERKARKIEIFGIEILEFRLEENCFTIKVDCSKGTYIRTLCNDIGRKLGCGANMKSLMRTKTGSFSIENSVTLDEIHECIENEDFSFVSSIGDVLSNYDKIIVAERNAFRIRNGIRPEIEGLIEGKSYRVYDESGQLLTLSQQKNGVLVMLKSFY